MTDKLTNPHDKFFKDVFSQREAAQNFLENYLPQPVLELLDLNNLDIRKDSFIDEHLQEHFSDLLYEVARNDQDAVYVYLLFEHKSVPEPLISFQLLRYMQKIWEQDQRQKKAFQVIIPLVLYHGLQTWQIKNDFASLFNLPEALRPYLPNFRYELYDLSRYDDDQLQGSILLQVVFTLLKYSQRDGLTMKLFEMVELLGQLLQQQTGLEIIRTILIYLSRGTEKVNKADLIELSRQVSAEKGVDLVATVAEEWIQEGREEGIKEGITLGEKRGREEGIVIGKEEGERQTLLETIGRIIKFRFGDAPDDLTETLAQFNRDRLKYLSEAIFEIDTLAAFMVEVETLSDSKRDISTD